jgi:hypothetical protein
VGPTYYNYTFMVYTMGTQQGPYGIGDLRMHAQAGNLKATTMVRRSDGVGSWFPAGELQGVFSTREWIPTLLISWFLGTFGVDRFYLGYTTLGILKLCTLGGCGIWHIVDVILIATGNLGDADGLPLKRS